MTALKEKRNLKKLKSHLDLKQLNEKPISAELVMIKKINDITPTEWNNQLPLPGMLYVKQKHGQTEETLHWNRALSGDELDAMMRHVIDKDWEQVAWRAMANLEKQLEKEHN